MDNEASSQNKFDGHIDNLVTRDHQFTDNEITGDMLYKEILLDSIGRNILAELESFKDGRHIRNIRNKNSA